MWLSIVGVLPSGAHLMRVSGRRSDAREALARFA
jgi:hypothetical protein